MPSKLEHKLHSLFWECNRPFVYWFMRRRFNCMVAQESDPMPKPPFVVVANHANFFDPWIVGYECRQALYIMMNDDGFRGSKLTGWYLRAIGAFPKKKGAHDYTAMKRTLQLLKSGHPVLIFPEGQTSWDGETQPIYSGIEKIIKRAGCALVMIHLHGNFLSKPWWATSARKGAIGLRTKMLLPADVAKLSDSELLDTIRSYIYNNDIKNPENSAVPFRGTGLAGGLERVAWICTHCEAEDALVVQGNVITCTVCSASWEIDSHFALTPRMPKIKPIGDLHDWMQWHKLWVKARISGVPSGEVLTQSHDVLMQSLGADDFVDRVSGTLTLTSKEISFAPSESSGQILHWPLEKVEDYVIQAKDIFEFRMGEEYIRMVFDRHSPMKWIYYVRYLKGFEEIEKRGYY